MRLLADIRVRQGRFSLRGGFDFKGSALGVFGPSGSGKSSLLRVMAGLARPAGGRLEMDGDVLFDITKQIWVPPHRRGVGVAFQDARLLPHWNTEKNLRAGMTATQAGAFSFDRIVDLLEIRPLLSRPVQNLSGGEQKRVALGRAVLAHPRVLLMDEPMSGLDAGLKDQILPFLKRVLEELHLPCVMVSHTLPELLTVTDRILWVRNGLIRGPFFVDELLLERESFEALRSSGLMSRLELPGGLAGVRPDEVMLANRPVEGLSARYCLAGRLYRMIDHGAVVLCLIETDAGRLMADVTPAAVQQLGLCEGDPVWSLFKSRALHRINAT